MVAVACFLPGRAKDLSALLLIVSFYIFNNYCLRISKSQCLSFTTSFVATVKISAARTPLILLSFVSGKVGRWELAKFMFDAISTAVVTAVGKGSI